MAVAASRVRVDYTFALIDVFLIVAAYFAGLGVTFLEPSVERHQKYLIGMIAVMPIIVLVHVAFNIAFGAYGHVWEHASLAEAKQVGLASAIGVAIILGVVTAVRGFGIVVPYPAVALGGLLSLVGMGLVRFRSRLFSYQKHGPANSRILVVGTSRAAATFAREAPDLKAGGQVVGFVAATHSPTRGARVLAGLPILGSVEKVAELIAQHSIDQVVIVGGSPELARLIVDKCLDIDVRLRIIPGTEDVMMGTSTRLDARDIQIDDLLARPPVSTDMSEVGSLIHGKRILVTGAGGSIGSEIVRQVLTFGPSHVHALDRDETLLHNASMDWSGPVSRILADIRDRSRIVRIFSELKPQVVFHAAALKHVPVLEEFPEEAVLTNIVGTLNLIDAGSITELERLVLISTDKAVDPASVMGASKRVAEMLVQTGNERRDGCEYTAVRFGNVLGSRGSVVPTFVEQVKRGGPVTVTEPDMTRYFMTVDEAVQLVLQAAALAKGSDVFVLDMGEPVRIVDLARRLIRLAGLAPGRDIPIVFTGRRKGEKLFEVLAEYPLEPTRHPAISVAEPPHPGALSVRAAVEALAEAASAGDRARIRGILTEMTLGLTFVPESLDLRSDEPAVTWS
ncbi:MAG TPA: nucleoside-diphosphate sugar epimerase/dehydratase [Acidimicrobiia bacterium]|nr:nucleoside-diphosphate sugar epimerase/dehydratase [Acidimicrobiia bacterium]